MKDYDTLRKAIEPNKVCGCCLTGIPLKDALVPKGAPHLVCDLRDDNGISMGMLVDVVMTKTKSNPWMSYTEFVPNVVLAKDNEFRKTGKLGSFVFKDGQWVHDAKAHQDYVNLSAMFSSINPKANQFLPSAYPSALARYIMNDYMCTRGAIFITKNKIESRKPMIFVCDIDKNEASVVISYPERYYNNYVPYFYEDKPLFQLSVLPAPAHTLLPSGMIVNGCVTMNLTKLLNRFKQKDETIPMVIDCANLNNIVSKEEYYNKISGFSCLDEDTKAFFKEEAETRYTKSELSEIVQQCIEYNSVAIKTINEMIGVQFTS